MSVRDLCAHAQPLPPPPPAPAGAGLYEQAASAFDRAVSLSPNYAFARANRAVVTFQLGRDTESIKEMR